MPQVGEIRKGREIGKKPYSSFLWSACSDCGKQRWVRIEGRKLITKRCKSCGQRGDRSFRWKGGRVKDGQGYILIKLQPNDFFYPMTKHDGYVYEHRLIMAKFLKHCLLPWEIVHHKNGIRDDNRKENLQLLSTQSHHIIDTNTKRYIHQLEKRVSSLEIEIGALRQSRNW